MRVLPHYQKGDKIGERYLVHQGLIDSEAKCTCASAS